jgi:hypothetical protein
LFIRVSNSGRTGQPPKRDSQQHTIRYTANQKVRTAKLKPIEYSANTPKFPALTGNFGVDGRRLGESGALFRYLDLIQPEYLFSTGYPQKTKSPILSEAQVIEYSLCFTPVLLVEIN